GSSRGAGEGALSKIYVAYATSVCCNSNMKTTTPPILHAILQRRAAKVFDAVEISPVLRGQILDAARMAPSSFNIQPYRFYWIETPEPRREAARLCMNQAPAASASALIVAVADLGSWKATTHSCLAWMRTAGFTAEKIEEFEERSKWGPIFFIQG